ncbi:MAG: Oligopeptide transport ATP-binding protein OppD [candidate division WS2 bacterium]|uniref:Oligopeptide transport ATP-binding protein OppD n=1 Tax=Psychracetigena formicireducens TaxID=2986056 RepID=A0A9E2BJP6_PSYF1|nr:Oligopeptide transport ATP-binding protein OppD [Candidatus Psychracetigena formicireducens]MBT9145720.1 Oligopeptide transport ATP-binding protein OppD [Candidatus Psychracetigena formicireducens]MBT9150937.1 Oligopeptide transport ATP-binding protein OppD [Candidatus Psychracetigena formicireducens]
MEIFSIKNLSVDFFSEVGSKLKILQDINLNIEKGKTHALMGESGSGKSVLALASLRLLPPMPSFSNPSKEVVQEIITNEVGLPKNIFIKTKDKRRSAITSLFTYKTLAGNYPYEWEVKGEVLFEDVDLLKLTDDELSQIRGKKISFIWQNPVEAMNPVMSIGKQTGEPLEIHDEVSHKRLKSLVVDFLGKVDIYEPKKRYTNIPKEFSKGEGQRIMISMALIANPSLLIADEPLASLDVTVQRRVMELLKVLKKEFNLSLLLITHNLGVIAEMADVVSVLYAGRIVETGTVQNVYKRPLHPYTRGLMSAIAWLNTEEELKPIPGELPDPLTPISGCAFHPRCSLVQEKCYTQVPELREVRYNHSIACFQYW